MRRKDRERDEAFALAVLDKCEYAFFSTVNADGGPYCIPVSPVRDGMFIYFHCAVKGQKLDNLQRDGRVCLACVGNTQLVPEKFTTLYESCVVFGKAGMVEAEAEKIHALRLLCEKYAPGYMDRFDSAVEKSLAVTGICKIEIEQATGKQKA